MKTKTKLKLKNKSKRKSHCAGPNAVGNQKMTSDIAQHGRLHDTTVPLQLNNYNNSKYDYPEVT